MGGDALPRCGLVYREFGSNRTAAQWLRCVPHVFTVAPSPCAQGVISNDGAKIMSLLDVVHPAAKTLVDIAQAQDAEIGDGTTTVVLLAGEFLKAAKQFVEDGVHPQIIIKVRGCAKGVLRAVCGAV